MLKLPHRDVDRHRQQGDELALPFAQLEAHGAQNPPADVPDRAALPGIRSEARRRDIGPIRRPPSKEGLEADGPQSLQVEARLILEGQFIPLERLPEGALQAKALPQTRVHFRCIELMVAATAVLRVV